MQLDGPHLDSAQSVRSLTQGNIAAVLLKQRDWAGAAAAASEGLVAGGGALPTSRPKLLFRRGVARREMGQTAEALDDLREAARLTPDDAAIRRELTLTQKQLREV